MPATRCTTSEPTRRPIKGVSETAGSNSSVPRPHHLPMAYDHRANGASGCVRCDRFWVSRGVVCVILHDSGRGLVVLERTFEGVSPVRNRRRCSESAEMQPAPLFSRPLSVCPTPREQAVFSVRKDQRGTVSAKLAISRFFYSPVRIRLKRDFG